MTIDRPSDAQAPQLRRLWKAAFGDADPFLDAFYGAAFSPDRCLCAGSEAQVLGAVYWFDCSYAGQKIAYIYALAVEKACRGRGIGSSLMDRAHALLESRGYQGVLLVPQEAGLVRMYEAMGYRLCTGIREFTCMPGPGAADLRPVDIAEYACLRRKYLPAGGVVQEGENLAFLTTQAKLYAGGDFLVAERREGDALFAMELLGSEAAAPGILRALGCSTGTFRTPGDEKMFAMYRPLTNTPACPTYFGLAFD